MYAFTHSLFGAIAAEWKKQFFGLSISLALVHLSGLLCPMPGYTIMWVKRGKLEYNNMQLQLDFLFHSIEL